jgi:anti-sigma regulatory factor (Ser/Thr protein kinase)
MALNQWFEGATLPALRKSVLAYAVAAGMPRHRAADVVLAVHELAANAVRHAGGTGRVQMWVADDVLHCLVSDEGRGSDDGHASAGTVVAVRPWLFKPGHGLWLVRGLADLLTTAPGPGGSQVTAVFVLPGGRA